MADKFASFVFKSFFLASCVLFLTFDVCADVAVDSTSSNGAFNQAGVPSLSWNHTVMTTGNNRVLYVGISTTSDTASSTIFPVLCNTIPAICSTTVPVPGAAVNRVMTVQYNGVMMERVGTKSSPDFQYVVEIFRLVAPSTGTHLVEADLTDGLAANVVGGSISLTGADEPPTGTLPTFYSNSGGNGSEPSLFIAGEPTRRGIALGVVATSPNAGFIGVDSVEQPERWNGRGYFNNAYDVGKGSTRIANPSTAFNWILTNTNSSWATGGVLVRSFITSASLASIGGQVKTKNGEPVKNVLITLQNVQTGETFRTNTDAKGFYSFANLTLVNLYQIRAYNNFHNFSPNNRLLNLTESLESVDFQATRRDRKKWFIR